MKEYLKERDMIVCYGMERKLYSDIVIVTMLLLVIIMIMTMIIFMLNMFDEYNG